LSGNTPAGLLIDAIRVRVNALNDFLASIANDEWCRKLRADACVSDNCHTAYVGTAHHFRKYLSHTVTD
jgi:hypothetical protein